MSEPRTPIGAFLISAQYGDVESAAALRPHFQSVKAALQTGHDSIPCKQIRQIAYVLRVSGSITNFNFEGCEAIELNRRKKYISIDLGVPIARWKGRSNFEIAQYLAEAFSQGLEQMLKRLRVERIESDEEAVRSMLQQGIERYLAVWSDPS